MTRFSVNPPELYANGPPADAAIGEILGIVTARRPSLVEALALLVPAVAFVVAMGLGDGNGIGVFHQPKNDLWAPLLIGLVTNGLLFYAVAFRLLPGLLDGDGPGRFSGQLASLATGFLFVKTLAHQIVIHFAEPSLLALRTTDLLIENAKSLVTFAVTAVLYGLLRRGLGTSREKPVAPEESSVEPGHLDFWSGRTLHRLPADDVLYLEGKGNYVKVVARSRSVMVYTTLRDQEARLCAGPDFARIHRSFIVSLRNLERADGSVVMVGDRRLPISESYSRAFRDKLRGVRGEAATPG